MNLKQKLNLLVAFLLPAIALSAYFMITPVPALAAGNPCHSPCGYEGLGCGNGAGGCYPNGYRGGIYVFCKNSQGQPTGPGSCSNGVVTCTYGSYC